MATPVRGARKAQKLRRARMRWFRKAAIRANKGKKDRKRKRDRRQGEASKGDHFDHQCKGDDEMMSEGESVRKTYDRKGKRALRHNMHLACCTLGSARDSRSARNGRGRRGIQYIRRADRYACPYRGEVCNIDTSFHSHFIRIRIFNFVFSTCCIVAVLARTHTQYHECAECMCIGRRNRHGADRYRAACRLTHTHSLQLHSIVSVPRHCKQVSHLC